MARYCIAGCGTELKLPDGSTDYDRQFCSKKCRDKDKSLRLRDQRMKLKAKTNCPTCGQMMPRPNA